jgi:competence protein ComEA
VRLSTRRPDDADAIRARLRALLDDRDRGSGWVPEALDEDDPGPRTGPPVVTEEEPQAPEGLGRHRAPGPAVRLNPGTRGARSLWVAGVCAVLLLLAWTWWERPTVEPVGRTAAPSSSAAAATAAAPSVGEMADTSSALVVSVVGLVARPGLVTLPPGSRVADAIEAAGGMLPDADPAMVNLAAVVSDGQQIAVGVAGAPEETGGGPGPAAGGKVDLNTATTADLDALPGIGPVLAQRIVDHRTAQGPYRSIDDLDDVPGIGPAIFGELADLVAVSG